MNPRVVFSNDRASNALGVLTSAFTAVRQAENLCDAPIFLIDIYRNFSVFYNQPRSLMLCLFGDQLSVGKSSCTSGTFRFVGVCDDTSWADFARAIMAAAGLSCRIVDIPSSAYPTPATRPANSRLDCRATSAVFGIDRLDWQDATRAIVTSLTQRKGTA